MLLGESPGVHLEGDTGASPLLEAALSRGAGGATTVNTGISLGVSGDRMTGLPVKVGTDGPGEVGSPLGSVPRMEARKHSPNKLREGPVTNVQTEEIGLP